MAVIPGTRLTLDLEKPTAGGRMLARHDGQVVLVWGGIPGERVEARVERAGKGVVFATVETVIEASADRRVARDWRCGGSVLAHVRYPRQLEIKAGIVGDAFARIARMPLPSSPPVLGSPETGYRMRARLHVREHRLGFYREGSHEICDAAVTGQLAPETENWLASVQEALRRHRLSGLAALEVGESVDGGQRACHLTLERGSEAASFAVLADGLTGITATRGDGPGAVRVAGEAFVKDGLYARPDDPATAFEVRRAARAFFQGNRFLLQPMVAHVTALVPAGPVVDLYAGVGLFGLACAAAGAGPLTFVEGDPVSGADLQANATAFGHRVRVVRDSVEAFVRGMRRHWDDATWIVDPPRAGLSRDATAGITGIRPRRIVYVSCDAPTLARDARLLADAGYALERIDLFDLFPNTAHVEAVALFVLTAR